MIILIIHHLAVDIMIVDTMITVDTTITVDTMSHHVIPTIHTIHHQKEDLIDVNHQIVTIMIILIIHRQVDEDPIDDKFES